MHHRTMMHHRHRTMGTIAADTKLNQEPQNGRTITLSRLLIVSPPWIEHIRSPSYYRNFPDDMKDFRIFRDCSRIGGCHGCCCVVQPDCSSCSSWDAYKAGESDVDAAADLVIVVAEAALATVAAAVAAALLLLFLLQLVVLTLLLLSWLLLSMLLLLLLMLLLLLPPASAAAAAAAAAGCCCCCCCCCCFYIYSLGPPMTTMPTGNFRLMESIEASSTPPVRRHNSGWTIYRSGSYGTRVRVPRTASRDYTRPSIESSWTVKCRNFRIHNLESGNFLGTQWCIERHRYTESEAIVERALEEAIKWVLKRRGVSDSKETRRI